MSNSIWHNKNERPMMHTDIILCGDGWSMPIGIVPETVNTICWENVEKWCYLDELITQADKAERLQKAVDLALERFDDIRRLYDKYYDKYSVIATETSEEIKQIIKDN